MKKTIFVLVLIALATGAFAQKISLDAHLSTSVFYPVVSSGVVLPSVGVVVDVGPVDILGNVEIYMASEKEKDSSVTVTERDSLLGFYAGIAPKLKPVDKLTLSFPFFTKIYFVTNRKKYSSTPDDGEYKKNTRGAFGFEAGARTSYAITPKWSVYAGIQAEMFSIYGKGKTTLYGGKKIDGTTTNFYWFDTGTIDLGVTYTFN